MTETNYLPTRAMDDIKAEYERGRGIWIANEAMRRQESTMIDAADLLSKLEKWLEMLLGPSRALEKHEHEYYSKKIAYCFDLYSCSENKQLKKNIEHLEHGTQGLLASCEKLQEENKQLMRENAEIVKKYNHCKSWNDKYEEMERGHLAKLDAMCKGLSRSCYNAGIDAASEYYEQLLSCSIFSGGEKNRRKHMQDLKSQYAAEAKPSEDGQPEPEWYDAEKCLPFIGRKVEIKYRGCGTKTAIAMLWFRNSALVFLIDKSYGRVNPPVVYSFLDVVSKWRYADE